MHGSESGGGKVFGRFSEPAHRVLDLAREEAERCGHRYLGPEHVLLGMLADGHSRASQPLDLVRGSRRHRQITAHVGLPEGYRGLGGIQR